MARESCLLEYRRRALRDRTLSDAASRFLALVVEDLYLERDWHTGQEFPLPWTRVGFVLGKSRRQCQRLLDELEAKSYLKPGSNCRFEGAPNVKHFFLVLKGVKNGALKGAKNDAVKGVKNGASHISSSLQEEIIDQRASPSSDREEEKSTSLRSLGKGGEDRQGSAFRPDFARLKEAVAGARPAPKSGGKL